jgi:peptide/nickel transport system permease protein
MLAYVVRRLIYAAAVLAGVNLLVFMLFFSVNTPEDMARLQLGGKRVTAEAVDRWKAERGYDKPLYFNAGMPGIGSLTETVFAETTIQMLRFDFGKTVEGRDIAEDIRERMPITFAIGIPVFLLTVGVSILFSLGLVLFRGTKLDAAGVVLLVTLMSISSLFFIIMGQFVFSKLLRLAPLSGYVPGPELVKFVLLPIAVLVVARLGPDARLYRAIYLEELGKDYVRTARSKGLTEFAVLFRHVLRNSLLPIITASASLLPVVLGGAIVTETFFALPGLGALTIEGITQQDFGIVRAMVFFGSTLYVAAYLATDLLYAVADPRIRLH